VSVTSTVYSKLDTQFLQSFSRRLHSSCFYVIKTDLNGSSEFQFLESVEKILVTGGILDDQFRAAVYGKDKRNFGLSELSDVLFGVSLKVGNGADFA
jgi:hypothetical protein